MIGVMILIISFGIKLAQRDVSSCSSLGVISIPRVAWRVWRKSACFREWSFIAVHGHVVELAALAGKGSVAAVENEERGEPRGSEPDEDGSSGPTADDIGFGQRC